MLGGTATYIHQTKHLISCTKLHVHVTLQDRLHVWKKSNHKQSSERESDRLGVDKANWVRIYDRFPILKCMNMERSR